MRKRVILISLFVLAVLAVSLAAVTGQDTVQVGSVTQAIIDRDSLICGVNQELPGFGSVNEAGEFEGFDIDICRAVAAGGSDL